MAFVPHNRVLGSGTQPCIGWFRYYTNSSSDPTSFEGPLKKYVSSITRAATGKMTVNFTSDFTFVSGKVPAFFFKSAADAVANLFVVSQLGAYSGTTLVLQQHNGSSTGIEPAAASTNFVEVFVYADMSAG